MGLHSSVGRAQKLLRRRLGFVFELICNFLNCYRGGSRIFLGGGALASCSTSTPINHMVFFCRIPVVLENRRSSRGGGVRSPCNLPLDPPLCYYDNCHDHIIKFVSVSFEFHPLIYLQHVLHITEFL